MPVAIIDELRKKRILEDKKQAVLDVFSDKLSWAGLFDGHFIDQRFYMSKSNTTINGIKTLSDRYANQKIIIRAPAGCGKTTSMMYLYMQSGCPFFYVRASIFETRGNKLTNYEKNIKEAVLKNIKINGTILIDGIEETYSNNIDREKHFINLIRKTSNNIWISCRPEYLSKLDSATIGVFDDIAELKQWEDSDYSQFLDQIEDISIRNKVNEIKQRSSINTPSFKCPLYLTMLVFILQEDTKKDVDDIQDEYDVLTSFVQLWIKREEKKKKEKHRSDWYNKTLQNIAYNIYRNGSYSIDKSQNIVKGLLKFNSRASRQAQAFYHREFLIYFIVEGMLDAAIKRPNDIIKWYYQTFTDEITNLLKTALKHKTLTIKQTIYINLFNCYKNSYENKPDFERIMQSNKIEIRDLDFLKLRDEILYVILKLYDVDNEDFVKYANDHKGNDIMLELGLAYGMAGQKQHPYTLSFARKLKPNGIAGKEELVNRSWAVCFFGDVKDDGMSYVDDGRCDWSKARKAKLTRIQKNEPKYYRYRLLDLPLLNCFYASRGYTDCISCIDYELLLKCDISYDQYTPEEKEFLETQKRDLLEAYMQNMLKNTMDNNAESIAPIIAYDTVYNNEKGYFEISNESKEKILEYIRSNEETNRNLADFWEKKGNWVIQQYEKKSKMPDFNPLAPEILNDKLRDCEVVILSANTVEGAMISRCLMDLNHVEKIDQITADKQSYHFSNIGSIRIVHILPLGTSSFTVHGSYNALKEAFKRFSPKYVFAIGVAFGADPSSQQLGDVLIADHLVFYDYFNKVTNGTVKLSADEVQEIGAEIFASCLAVSDKTGPQDKCLGDFCWRKGAILTGGSVISDSVERDRLKKGADKIGWDIIGGEMEGSGIFFGCNGKDTPVPFTIVKGICDWAVNKNGWSFVAKTKDEQDTIKDCIQAYACDNAFRTVVYILDQLFPHNT